MLQVFFATQTLKHPVSLFSPGTIANQSYICTFIHTLLKHKKDRPAKYYTHTHKATTQCLENKKHTLLIIHILTQRHGLTFEHTQS